MPIWSIFSSESNFCDSSQRTGSVVSDTAVATSASEVKVDSMISARASAGTLSRSACCPSSAARSTATAPPRECP